MRVCMSTGSVMLQIHFEKVDKIDKIDKRNDKIVFMRFSRNKSSGIVFRK